MVQLIHFYSELRLEAGLLPAMPRGPLGVPALTPSVLPASFRSLPSVA